MPATATMNMTEVRRTAEGLGFRGGEEGQGLGLQHCRQYQPCPQYQVSPCAPLTLSVDIFRLHDPLDCFPEQCACRGGQDGGDSGRGPMDCFPERSAPAQGGESKGGKGGSGRDSFLCVCARQAPQQMHGLSVTIQSISPASSGNHQVTRDRPLLPSPPAENSRSAWVSTSGVGAS